MSHVIITYFITKLSHSVVMKSIVGGHMKRVEKIPNGRESWRNEEPITGHFADSDLLIFGDIAPARSKIIRLCEMRYAAYTRTAHMHARPMTQWDFRLRVGILSILTTSAKLRARIAQHRRSCRQLETTRGRKTFIFCYCDYIGNKIKPYVIFNRGIITS